MTSSISAWIWSETFWLPENVSWADLEHPPPGVEYPRVGQMLGALPLAAGVFLLRRLFERYMTVFGLVRLLRDSDSRGKCDTDVTVLG